MWGDPARAFGDFSVMASDKFKGKSLAWSETKGVGVIYRTAAGENSPIYQDMTD